MHHSEKKKTEMKGTIDGQIEHLWLLATCRLLVATEGRSTWCIAYFLIPISVRSQDKTWLTSTLYSRLSRQFVLFVYSFLYTRCVHRLFKFIFNKFCQNIIIEVWFIIIIIQITVIYKAFRNWNKHLDVKFFSQITFVIFFIE